MKRNRIKAKTRKMDWRSSHGYIFIFVRLACTFYEFSFKIIRLLMIIHLTSASYIDFSGRIFDWWHCLKGAAVCATDRIGSANVESVHGVLHTWDCAVGNRPYAGREGGWHWASSAWVTVQIHSTSITLRIWCCRRVLSINWRNRILLVIIKHMSQDILRILQSLGHFCIITVKSLIERHRWSLSFLVYVGDKPVFRIKQYLCVILEVDLDNLVAQPKHNCMFCSHPFLDINWARRVLKLISLVQLVPLHELFFFLRIIVLLQIRLEVL